MSGNQFRFSKQLTGAVLLALAAACVVSGQQDPSRSEPASTTTARINEALELVRQAANRLGRDIHLGLQQTTCLQSMLPHYHSKSQFPAPFSIASVVWPELHAQVATNMGHSMRWARETVESIVAEAESLAANHSFRKDLSQEFTDVYLVTNSDESPVEEGLPLEGLAGSDNNTLGEEPPSAETLPTPDSLQSEPIQSGGSQSSSSAQQQQPSSSKPLKLSPHPNFDDTLVNTDESAVHVPVHLFSGEPQIMNGIAWSEALTSTFHNNLVQNPTLNNQYFASHDGFMRLFPARRWPIAQSQPDLYDARMRPWYLAGASSRKDVIVLVDSSGSMTGSRRDIAKGVVFEILDTLTDNDNFLVLRFSDSVHQVGVPACQGMRVERPNSSVPLRNTLFMAGPPPIAARLDAANESSAPDYGAFYLTQASGKNILHIKSNFSIPTAGIANFSRALVTAFEVLANYQQSASDGQVQCNQAIMLITDGAPSDFMDIFARYNVPNAPVRVFTYLIGREAGDVTNTRMMACHNRGFYTHVINLAEVRETVQQYIPVMARPLVLSGHHPILWTPAYGDLTYQILTDWVWESRRRDKARALVKGQRGGTSSSVSITSEESSLLEDEFNDPAIDLFGYNSNPQCFWQMNRNDLLTTVVQPVYDRRKETNVTEKYLYKNQWTTRETLRRTAKILGVAAADMKINHLMSFADSHRLGVNAYPILLTNNGFVMHHPDLRSILEPSGEDPSSSRDMRILKPFFSSLDFSEVEQALDDPSSQATLMTLRREAILGLTGFRKLSTKRMLDCQKRVQTREQNFYYKPIDQFPFSFIIATPEPYGSRRIQATVDIKTAKLPEKLLTYFNGGDTGDSPAMEFFTVHPEYKYCVGPSNNTIATLLDMLGRLDRGSTQDLQWKPPESTKPPIFLPGKIVCDKQLVESLVFDAVATYHFSRGCKGAATDNDESSLLGMFGVRFAFVSTRSGLLRVRYFDYQDDRAKREAATFVRQHNRGVDETFYSRTVDYNMLINKNATLIQVPFNTHQRIRQKLDLYRQTMAASDNLNAYETGAGNETMGELSSEVTPAQSLEEKLRDVLANTSLHVIATHSIIGEEGPRSAVAGVTGVFYDFATFMLRFFKLTNEKLEQNTLRSPPNTCNESSDKICDPTTNQKVPMSCGNLEDDVDCLLVDNNGYIVISEDLDFIGSSLKSYQPQVMESLVRLGLYHQVNVTDYQAICTRQEEKQQVTSASGSTLSMFNRLSLTSVLKNLVSASFYTFTLLMQLTSAYSTISPSQNSPYTVQQRNSRELLPMSSLLPNKTYLRPCERTHILYETRSDYPERGYEVVANTSSAPNCNLWFVYDRVPNTNLLMLVVKVNRDKYSCGDSTSATDYWTRPSVVETVESGEPDESGVCNRLEHEWRLPKKRIDTCFSHHPDEDNIKLCDSATSLLGQANKRVILLVGLLVSLLVNSSFITSFTIIHAG